MKALIVKIIEAVTFNKVRGQHNFYSAPSLRWWYIGTKRFGHGGWIFLSASWLMRFTTEAQR